VFSLGLYTIHRVGNLYSKSRAAKRHDASNRGALNVKWWELEFSLLPSSTLKSLPRNAKGLRRLRGLWLSAENLTAEPFSLWNFAVKFYHGVGIPQYIGEWWLAFRSPFESGLPRCYSCCGNPRSNDRGTWQMTEFQHPPFYIESPPV
jgi:hypothetical protein